MDDGQALQSNTESSGVRSGINSSRQKTASAPTSAIGARAVLCSIRVLSG